MCSNNLRCNSFLRLRNACLVRQSRSNPKMRFSWPLLNYYIYYTSRNLLKNSLFMQIFKGFYFTTNLGWLINLIETCAVVARKAFSAFKTRFTDFYFHFQYFGSLTKCNVLRLCNRIALSFRKFCC